MDLYDISLPQIVKYIPERLFVLPCFLLASMLPLKVKITPKMAIIAQIKIERIIKLHDTPNPSKLTVYVFALFDCFTNR